MGISWRFVFCLALACLAVQTRADDASLHDRVLATYSFLPRNLNQQQLATKSQELDEFWALVKVRGPTGLEALRTELLRPDAPIFFSYDGAKLLLSLSSSQSDQQAALRSIVRADLVDLQRVDYFLTVHALAVEGRDTADAAFKILDDEKFAVVIPQHALTLDQEECLMFLLLPTQESFYLDRAIDRLFVAKSISAQKSLLSVIAYTVTKKGDAAVVKFREDASQPQESRDYAKLILDSIGPMASVPVIGWSLKTYDELKQKQRALFARVSDEALIAEERLRLKLRHVGPR